MTTIIKRMNTMKTHILKLLNQCFAPIFNTGKILLAAYLSLVTATAAAQQTDAPVADIVELDRIVALVNDDVIMQSELNSRINKVRQKLEEQKIPSPPIHVLIKQVTERLILQRLQLQEAERSGIRIDDQTLNRVIQKIAEGNRLSMEQFRRLLERDGFSFAQFREDVRGEIMIGRIRSKKVQNRVKVSEQEIDYLLENLEKRGDTINSYQLAHILISIPEGSVPEEIERRRNKMEEIIAELKLGADFRQMAATYSDAQTAMTGGDLGWRKHSELPSAFEEVVPNMNKGEMSDIIRTPSGFHLVKLTDTRGENQIMVTQTKVRHILIKSSQIVSESNARSRLQQLRERILSGEDFAQLARANSDDSASAIDGGDLGWVMPGVLEPEFEDVMEAVDVGEVSEPFSTPFGWHILRVDDRRQQDGTLEYRRNKARETISKRKTEEELELWLHRLRDEAYVELRLEETEQL